VQLIQQEEPVSLPASFPGQSDTSSIGSLSWKQLFTDKHLQRLIDTALHNNWDLQTAIQRVEMARANYLQTRGALKPSVQATASAGADKYGDYTLNGVGNYDTNLSGNLDKDQKIPMPLTPEFFLGLRSSWEIDLWGKLRNRKTASFHRILSSQKGVQLVSTLLVSEVSSRYYELLALDDEMEILRKNIELQEAAVEIVQALKAGGRATELAVQQFTAQLLRTRSLEAEFHQQIIETENELNLLLGRLPQQIERSKSILQYQLPETVQAGIPSSLLLRRPDIQQAELELKASEADVEAARAAFLPSLTITPYLGLNAFSTATLFNPASIAYGAIGGLAAPLFNRSALKGDHQRAMAASREAFYAYQKAIMSGYHEVVTGLKGLKNLQKQYDLTKKETEVLRTAVSTANDLYLAGAASYLEVITAQKSVVEAEINLITTKKEMMLTLVSLYRALGGGGK
jgi:NodT family efflux transporter outer membrane factor (OMF) lipoprotein